MPRPRTASAGERGAVTAEYAALLPAVVLILVAVVLAGVWPLTTTGVVLVLGTGVYTLVMAELQYQGVRRISKA